jgi:hypothetical protein
MSIDWKLSARWASDWLCESHGWEQCFLTADSLLCVPLCLYWVIEDVGVIDNLWLCESLIKIDHANPLVGKVKVAIWTCNSWTILLSWFVAKTTAVQTTICLSRWRQLIYGHGIASGKPWLIMRVPNWGIVKVVQWTCSSRIILLIYYYCKTDT